MPSPESRAPATDAQPACGRGCTVICAACSSFELEPDWDAGLTQNATAKTSTAADPKAAEAKPPIPPPEPRSDDRSWLDARLADIASKLEQTIKTYDPAPALDKFSTRLDNFEARVEAVVDRAVAAQDPESLRFIEARVREIDDQFDKMRGQIGRISTIDARVAEIWDHVQLDLPSPNAGLPKLVEGAVSRALAAASVLKAEGAAAEGPEVAAFERIEDALNRLIERVEAIEVQSNAGSDERSDDPHDDIELINRAYEEGARALGLIMTDAPGDSVYTLRALHAADYIPRTETASSARASADQDRIADEIASAKMPDAPVATARAVAPTAETHPQAVYVRPPASSISAADDLRESFRASALRAKQKAQGEAEMYARALPRPPTEAVPVSESDTSGTARIKEQPISALFPPALKIDTSDDTESTAPPSAVMRPAEDDRAKALAQAKDTAAAAIARAQRPLSQGRWNRGFFLGLAMIALAAASYATVDHLMSGTPEDVTRSLSSPRNDINSSQRTFSRVEKAAVEQPTPAALPPDASPDLSGPEARAATLPATIASASLRHAAANGDPAAEFEIGSRYSEGRGVSPDPVQAFLWYQRSAAHGYAPAQFRLGSFYERGTGVEKDLERAKVWYRRASERGHAKAMHNLAVLLSSGDNPDMLQAARWFREAAERNLADSQYNLAMLNEAGQGIPKNLAEAFKWYALAARSGDTEAAKRLDIVRRQLSKSEIANAEKGVKTWMPVDMAPPAGTASVPERAQP